MTGENARSRGAHVVMDVSSRVLKARKIEAILSLDGGRPLRLLEVGTGSGAIAAYFADHSTGRFDVDAVDVLDSRLVRDGFRFTQVEGTQLPFDDEAFDVVVSNHVIEHVGDRQAQHHHLQELRRVMKRDAYGYLAVPSRWMLVEPHYKLAFLSWLPRRMRDGYISWWRDVPYYDCEPLTSAELEGLFDDAGLTARSRGTDALVLTMELERPGSLGHRLVKNVPRRSLRWFERALPTHIYTFCRTC